MTSTERLQFRLHPSFSSALPLEILCLKSFALLNANSDATGVSDTQLRKAIVTDVDYFTQETGLACPDNHSIALGSSSCIHCSSNYNFVWLTAVFAVAGVALIAFLLVLTPESHNFLRDNKRTIFYANIISVSGVLNLPGHPILSIFVAWTNLDWGIEMCYYPSMDAYQKTWLQFVFPFCTSGYWPLPSSLQATTPPEPRSCLAGTA